MRIADLMHFMQARHAIYLRRAAGVSRPWTNDPILQDYRFCNVYRELDKETAWIRTNWREPLANDENLFFAMTVARVVNWSPTLAEMKLPVPFKRSDFVRVLNKRAAAGQQVWTGAYMITTHGRAIPKQLYYADHVLQPIWDARKEIAPRDGDTLASFHRRLAAQEGIGSFLAAQVVADTKRHGPLRNAPDWWSWAAMGEGSRRGLNRVFDRPYKQRVSPQVWQRDFNALWREVNTEIRRVGCNLNAAIDAQDLQNCLCEFDKYERVRLEQGRPRSKYNGRGE